MTAPRKNIPADAPKPQDRKAKKSAAARKAEAEGSATIEQCGVTLRFPTKNLPMKAVLRYQGLNDDLTPIEPKQMIPTMGLRELLGAEQWSAFLAKNPTIEDFEQASDKIGEVLGN